MVNTTSELVWITHLLRDLHASPTTSPALFCDNKSAIFLSQNLVAHKRAKHIDIDYHFVRELMSKSVIPFYTPEESLRLINGKWKLTGPNFPVWKLHLDNVLSAQGKLYVLDKPISRPKSNSPEKEFAQYFKYLADESDVMSVLIFPLPLTMSDREDGEHRAIPHGHPEHGLLCDQKSQV
ncbi:hypothetical protein OSB04_001620 [Centaurea solstitialis]|uniref:Uncharacterized protein n=1 Tax=Centaurea solstitialis TaxID=347529 RepID=A0AA38WUJ3_9ASTR|nr:hypothetical protein OSB04_001620 [Centaurea solstitialis]